MSYIEIGALCLTCFIFGGMCTAIHLKKKLNEELKRKNKKYSKNTVFIPD